MSDNNHNHDHDDEYGHEDDFMMAFQDSADKPTLLLIHGFPLNSNMWVPQLEDLANFVRVIAPDLRGFGHSDGVKAPYSVQMLADDCADLLGYLNVATPFVVCGLSMGGYIALEFYRRYPEHVAGLILTATRAAADSDEGKANRDKMLELVERRGATAVTEPMLQKLLAPGNLEDDELMDYLRDLMETASDEGVKGALVALRDRPDSTPMLGDIAVPVLIIHGEDDQIVPVAEAKAMAAAIPDVRLVVLPEVGHMPNLEAPDAFNDAVLDFLEELGFEEE